MNSLKPFLLTSLKNYNRSQFFKDVTAGIIVAIIALPLSIALALASGVGPEAGIFTAIVAGFIISALGGSCVQIAGPTAAFGNDRRRYCSKRRYGWSCDRNDPCRYLSYLYGPVSFRKSDQIHPLHDHNGIHIRNRCHDCDRTT